MHKVYFVAKLSFEFYVYYEMATSDLARPTRL